MANSRLCRGGKKGHWEALTSDNIDLITEHLDIIGNIRLAACSRELYDQISKDEGKMHYWDEPCMLKPHPAYWFDEHWDKARVNHLHDTVYEVVPLDHPLRTIVLPFMHDRFSLGADEHGHWCLANIYTEQHIHLPSLPTYHFDGITDSYIRWGPAKYRIDWGPNINLLKIVICEVPTKGGSYADYKLIALFDGTISYLEGGSKHWRLMQAQKNQGPDSPKYCDAIELGGLIFAVDENDRCTYYWDAANANLKLPFVIRPLVVDDGPCAWFLARSADGKCLMIILTVYHIGITHGEVPPDIPYADNGHKLRQYPPVATYVFVQDPISTGPTDALVWRQVNSLGDHSLFLRLNYPITDNRKKHEAQAPDGTFVPFIRKNCVYKAY